MQVKSNELKTCAKCGNVKYKNQFHKDAKRKDGLRPYCKHCEFLQLKRYRETNQTKVQTARLKNKLKYRYNISYEDFQKMQEFSGNRCYICGDHETAVNSTGETRMLSIDHNHITGEVRGLLCHKCNAGLGYFRDNPVFLESAKQYLTKDRTLFYAGKKQ